MDIVERIERYLSSFAMQIKEMQCTNNREQIQPDLLQNNTNLQNT